MSASRSLATLLTLLVLASCGSPAPATDSGTDTGQSGADMGAVDAFRPDTGPMADPCATNHDCVSCFNAMNCGWCGTTNACVTGTQNGSRDGACTATNWSFGGVQGYCPDAVAFCAMNTDCMSCTMDPVCGWCNGQCVPGTGNGPIMAGHDVMCSGAWAWQVMDCTADDGGTTDDGGSTTDAGTAVDAGTSVDASSTDVGATPG